MNIRPFFDKRTSTLTYVVWDPSTLDAVVIDPVLDFDPASGRIWEDPVAPPAGLTVHPSTLPRPVMLRPGASGSMTTGVIPQKCNKSPHPELRGRPLLAGTSAARALRWAE